MNPAERVQAIYAEVQAIEAAMSLLNWDRQVLMPPGGAAARTAHVQRLASMRHLRMTGDPMRRSLEALEAEAEPGSSDAALARVVRRDVDQLTCLPLDLVQAKSRVSSEAYEVWKAAKAENDYPRLAPFLADLFDIARESSRFLGPCDHVYDNLIDLFEEGATHAQAASMFDAIRGPIVAWVAEIRDRGIPVDDSSLETDWDQAALRSWAQDAASTIGFDFRRGRLDLAPNAFCTHLATDDIRMTTRPSDHVKGVLSSTLHEMGHGLYEQNQRPDWDRTPLSGGSSLAVHESQSRLWENIVGRSRGFWRFFFPSLAERFPHLAPLGAEGFYRAFAKVSPTFVRVGADELTYNLHILVRFELEVEILTRRLDLRDLPEAWNAKYQAYLGIRPRTDSEGCLQDVHWARGSVGYFPTYAMGNMIGGQIWERLQAELGDQQSEMERGNFAPILGWLAERVYRPGRSLAPKDLVRQVVGGDFAADAWLRYAEAKYRDLYGLAA